MFILLRIKPSPVQQFKAFVHCCILLFTVLYLANTTSLHPYTMSNCSGLSNHLVASKNTSGSSDPDSFIQTPNPGLQPSWGPSPSFPWVSPSSVAVSTPLLSPSQGGGQAVSLFPHSNPGVPFVPQPMGVQNTAPLPQFPHLLASLPYGLPFGIVSSHPGQLPVGPALQSREYNVYSSSHQVQGESQNNHTPQGENSSKNSHNSSGWTSGFTTILQDLSVE